MPAAGRRSLDGALAWGKNQVGNYGWRRKCLGFVRQCWGIAASGIDDAADGYALTKYRHTDKTPPPGAPVWFDGPTVQDHVALSVGNGYVYSNDVIEPGRIDKVKINTILDRWNCSYRGWSEDYPRFGKLPLDLIDELDYAAEFEVGQHVVVSTRAGLKARSAPGTESSTLLYRGGELLTVGYGYGIHLTKITEEDGILWGKGKKYTYALADKNKAFVKLARR